MVFWMLDDIPKRTSIHSKIYWLVENNYVYCLNSQRWFELNGVSITIQSIKYTPFCAVTHLITQHFL